MFSQDIEDMYYSLDTKLLLDYVSNAIYEHGIWDFENPSGFSGTGFVDLIAI